MFGSQKLKVWAVHVTFCPTDRPIICKTKWIILRRRASVLQNKMQFFPIIRLAIPTRVAAPFDHPDWVFELKHDGFRALAHIADGRCSLISRKNNVYKSFVSLRETWLVCGYGMPY